MHADIAPSRARATGHYSSCLKALHLCSPIGRRHLILPGSVVIWKTLSVSLPFFIAARAQFKCCSSFGLCSSKKAQDPIEDDRRSSKTSLEPERTEVIKSNFCRKRSHDNCLQKM